MTGGAAGGAIGAWSASLLEGQDNPGMPLQPTMLFTELQNSLGSGKSTGQ